MEDEKLTNPEGKEMFEKPREQEKISHQEQKLLEHKKQVEELTNDLKRLQAEFENYKRRVEKEKEEMKKQANAEIIKSLLIIVDELEIAIQHVKDKGIEMIHSNLILTLKTYGLHEMNDKKFDPYKHEAIKQVDDAEDGKIVEVLKKGYVLNNSVIRPALVVVSRKK